MKTCPKCQELHNKSGTFCSRSCGNSRGPRSEEFKTRVRNKLRKTFNQCVICGVTTPKQRKTCSAECLTKLNKTKTPPKHPGGYRQGSGRGKHGWYKGYYLDSNYELAYLIYCLDHNIEIQRNKQSYQYTDLDNKVKNFYPDFRVNGKLTEIKGFYTHNLDLKIQSVTEPIDVLFPKQLQEVFAYVKNKTRLEIKNLYQLYETGTP